MNRRQFLRWTAGVTAATVAMGLADRATAAEPALAREAVATGQEAGYVTKVAGPVQPIQGATIDWATVERRYREDRATLAAGHMYWIPSNRNHVHSINIPTRIAEPVEDRLRYLVAQRVGVMSPRELDLTNEWIEWFAYYDKLE
jgi:hypothetical protein